MKKVFSLIIFLLSICMFTSVYADEILFRGVSWGVNPAQAKKQIDNPKLYMQKTYTNGSIAYPSMNAERLVDQSKNFWYGNSEFFSQKEVLTRVCSLFNKKEAKVGGYKLDLLNMYFANDIQDGEINYDEKSSHFAMAEYTFDVLDGNTAYDNLKEKLTSLYGVGEEIKDEYKGTMWYDNEGHNYIKKTSLVTFTGDNDTHAQLMCIEMIAEEEPDKPGFEMMLTYWSEQYVALIKEMDSILIQKEYDEKLAEEYSTAWYDFGGL